MLSFGEDADNIFLEQFLRLPIEAYSSMQLAKHIFNPDDENLKKGKGVGVNVGVG